MEEISNMELPKIKGKVEFRKVNFSYEQNEVLKDVSLWSILE